MTEQTPYMVTRFRARKSLGSENGASELREDLESRSGRDEENISRKTTHKPLSMAVANVEVATLVCAGGPVIEEWHVPLDDIYSDIVKKSWKGNIRDPVRWSGTANTPNRTAFSRNCRVKAYPWNRVGRCTSCIFRDESSPLKCSFARANREANASLGTELATEQETPVAAGVRQEMGRKRRRASVPDGPLTGRPTEPQRKRGPGRPRKSMPTEALPSRSNLSTPPISDAQGQRIRTPKTTAGQGASSEFSKATSLRSPLGEPGIRMSRRLRRTTAEELGTTDSGQSSSGFDALSMAERNRMSVLSTQLQLSTMINLKNILKDIQEDGDKAKLEIQAAREYLALAENRATETGRIRRQVEALGAQMKKLTEL